MSINASLSVEYAPTLLVGKSPKIGDECPFLRWQSANPVLNGRAFRASHHGAVAGPSDLVLCECQAHVDSPSIPSLTSACIGYGSSIPAKTANHPQVP